MTKHFARTAETAKQASTLAQTYVRTDGRIHIYDFLFSQQRERTHYNKTESEIEIELMV